MNCPQMKDKIIKVVPLLVCNDSLESCRKLHFPEILFVASKTGNAAQTIKLIFDCFDIWSHTLLHQWGPAAMQGTASAIGNNFGSSILPEDTVTGLVGMIFEPPTPWFFAQSAKPSVVCILYEKKTGWIPLHSLISLLRSHHFSIKNRKKKSLFWKTKVCWSPRYAQAKLLPPERNAFPGIHRVALLLMFP